LFIIDKIAVSFGFNLLPWQRCLKFVGAIKVPPL